MGSSRPVRRAPDDGRSARRDVHIRRPQVNHRLEESLEFLLVHTLPARVRAG